MISFPPLPHSFHSAFGSVLFLLKKGAKQKGRYIRRVTVPTVQFTVMFSPSRPPSFSPAPIFFINLSCRCFLRGRESLLWLLLRSFLPRRFSVDTPPTATAGRQLRRRVTAEGSVAHARTRPFTHACTRFSISFWGFLNSKNTRVPPCLQVLAV